MTDNMLGPSPMHIKYVYWTMRRPDSVCRNWATMDQYHGTHNAFYDVISIVYASGIFFRCFDFYTYQMRSPMQ